MLRLSFYILSLSISLIYGHDLLIFDEFQFEFNLLDSSDWDEYELNPDNYKDINKKLTSDDINPFERRRRLTSADYATRCTDTIPVIFKQLCVHFDGEKGFKFNYQAPTPIFSRLHDTDWFYSQDNVQNDRVSDAKAADAQYGDLIGAQDVYIGDDAQWNEINYANSISSFSLNNEASHNHYLKNFAKGSFKQCRHSKFIQECTEFHLPSKTLTVRIKTAKYRKETDENEKSAKQIPANLYDDVVNSVSAKSIQKNEYDNDEDEEIINEMLEDIKPYDFDHEFEYGDNRGYRNWAADRMKWKRFKCQNCRNNAFGRRRLIEDEEKSEYEQYGDYTFLYHDHALDFANDEDWNDISKDGGMKCSIAIPGLSHKVCVDLTQSAKDATISFAAAEDEDVDNAYYDMYGYDLYYYNSDHLYEHKHHKPNDNDEDIPLSEVHLSDAQSELFDVDRDTDTDEQRQSNNNGDDDDYNYDYYHTHSDDKKNVDDIDDNDDNDDRDVDDKDDKDADVLDNLSASAENQLDDIRRQRRRRSDNNPADDAQRYPDSYQQWKDQEQNQQQMMMNPMMNMMNPMMQSMMAMNGQQRRRLYDEDLYEQMIDEEEDELDRFNNLFLNALRDEFSDASLDFNNDEQWDEVTHVNDANQNKYTRKCASFQIAQLCATSDAQRNDLKLNLKIGKHKFHRTYRPWETQKSNALEAMTNIYADNFGQSNRDEKWFIDGGVIDVDDEEWNDANLWSDIAQIEHKTTKLKKKILRKCKGKTFCLCKYEDEMFDHGNKHKCSSYKVQKRYQPKYKFLGRLMDEFMSKPLMMHRPMHLQFQYHPSIVHLHIMGRYPFFRRRHHLHRYRIPWFKYKQYQHLRPNVRPKWCPRWIWREVEGHMKRPQGLKHHKATEGSAAAHFDEEDYYDYDGDALDEQDANENDDGFFEDELPFISPLIQSASALLPNVLENARKSLPKLLRKSVRRGGFIHNALKGRGGPEYYGTMGGFGGGKIREIFEDGEKAKEKKEAMMEQYGLRRRRMALFEDTYDEADDYYFDEDMTDDYDDDLVLDEWFDEDENMDWVILADEWNDDEFDDDDQMEWDVVHKDIMAKSGKKITKRCMNIFGEELCLCQFLGFIHAKPAANHLCYPKKKMVKHKPIKHKPVKHKPVKKHELTSAQKKKKLEIKRKKQEAAKKKKLEMKKKEEHAKKVKEAAKKKKLEQMKKQNMAKQKKEKMKNKKKKPKGPKKPKGKKMPKGKMEKKKPKKPKHPKVEKKKVKPEKKSHDPEKRLINGKPLGPKTVKRLEMAKKEQKKEISHKKEKKEEHKELLKKAEKNILKEKAMEIRKEVKGQLPSKRPLWMPHYFWHWLHRAPHFHLLRHKYRQPWKPHYDKKKGKKETLGKIEKKEMNEKKEKGKKEEEKKKKEMSKHEDKKKEASALAEEDNMYDEAKLMLENEDESDEVDANNVIASANAMLVDYDNEYYDDDDDDDYDDDDHEMEESEQVGANNAIASAHAEISVYDDEEYFDDDDDDDLDDDYYKFYHRYDNVNDDKASQDAEDDEEIEAENVKVAHQNADRETNSFESDDESEEQNVASAVMQDKNEYLKDEEVFKGWSDYDDIDDLYDENDHVQYEDISNNIFSKDDDDDNSVHNVAEKEYEIAIENENFLDDGNDFVEIKSDSGSYLWTIAMMSFIAFFAFAMFMFVGTKRREKFIQRQDADQRYLQKALQMSGSESESESESGCEQEDDHLNVE